jgi:hypothetical protein
LPLAATVVSNVTLLGFDAICYLHLSSIGPASRQGGKVQVRRVASDAT